MFSGDVEKVNWEQMGQSYRGRCKTFHTEQLFNEFGSQEKFWLDIISGFLVRIHLVRGGRVPPLNLNKFDQMS